MNKNLIIVIVIGLLVVAGLLFWMMQATNESVESNLQPEGEPIITDSTTSINESIEGVDVGDLDGEFEEIDADLNSL